LLRLTERRLALERVFTLACDYLVMAAESVIGFNFCKLGIHPGKKSFV
jgi:enoyl-CoA hydratase/carnithine racemase